MNLPLPPPPPPSNDGVDQQGDLFEMACLVHSQKKPAGLGFVDPANQNHGHQYSRELSELNAVGIYRLRLQDGSVVLKERASDLMEKHKVCLKRIQEAEELNLVGWCMVAKRIPVVSDLSDSGQIQARYSERRKQIFVLADPFTFEAAQILETIEAKDFSVEAIDRTTQKNVAAAVGAGAALGIGLGVVTGGLGLLGAAAGVQTGNINKILFAINIVDGRRWICEAKYDFYKSIAIASESL